MTQLWRAAKVSSLAGRGNAAAIGSPHVCEASGLRRSEWTSPAAGYGRVESTWSRRRRGPASEDTAATPSVRVG